MFKKILVAVENNQIGNLVFDEALALAKATNAGLMLVHVMSPYSDRTINPISMDTYSFYPAIHSEALTQTLKQWDGLKQESIDFLNFLCKVANSEGLTAEFTQNFGDPGRIICEMARNWQADVIILGRRGHAGLSEFFLGSVSNYVLHHAHCSVLAIQGLIPAVKNVSETEQQVVMS
ncbi:universal stress protein [Brunnivagina elsteri]|uniref:Universal stress protein UspA n=1 Tax=Brunnivagina elsteri CCALA 953 TaxID=987040 RepID=A0A2A2THM4_9CYAN|nr:universal stress protein [Calothrix elsteri]PAX53307.1 universal stress protein UspA [Calothrix elsteri CCALA 953]